MSLSGAKEWIPNPNSAIRDTLENNGYVIDTTNDKIFVPFSELKQVLTTAEVCKGMSDTALGRELSKLGLESHQAKVSGKNIIVRKFIKKEEVSMDPIS